MKNSGKIVSLDEERITFTLKTTFKRILLSFLLYFDTKTACKEKNEKNLNAFLVLANMQMNSLTQEQESMYLKLIKLLLLFHINLLLKTTPSSLKLLNIKPLPLKIT